MKREGGHTTAERTAESPQAKEYNFEDGYKELIRLIEQKFLEQDMVVVAVNTSSGGSNFGKSYLGANLAKEFKTRHMPVLICDSSPSSKNWKMTFEQDRRAWRTKRGLAILSAEASDRKYTDAKSRTDLRRESDALAKTLSGGLIRKIDIWVGLYKPDEPFEETLGGKKAYPLADIIIRNEKAVDDKTKMHQKI